VSHVIRCPETGLVEWFDEAGFHRCPFCGKSHETYEAGAPLKEEGLPNVIGDKLPKHMDYSCGAVIDSKSQRRRVYKEKGLVERSISEHRKENPEIMARRGTISSYSGQADRSSPRGRKEI
jgi:hypothetical protein